MGGVGDGTCTALFLMYNLLFVAQVSTHAAIQEIYDQMNAMDEWVKVL